MPAASIGIYEAPGGNAIQLVDNIKDLLKDTDMPPGMDYLVSPGFHAGRPRRD